MNKVEVGRVSVSIANIYRQANYSSEITSQALLAEKIFIEKKQKNFSRIKQADDYSGWISNYQWTPEKFFDFPLKMVRAHWLKIYREPNLSAAPIGEASIGTRLPVCQSSDGWLQIILPDGQTGWVAESNFGEPLPLTRLNAVRLAQEFYGIPYFWGGRSSRGFDCSGLIQTVFALMARQLPRDSWMQQRDGIFVSGNPLDAKPGDLYFFSDNGERITHVGLSAGNGRLIHARGKVRLNSLQSDHPAFDKNLLDTFVDIRTYFQ